MKTEEWRPIAGYEGRYMVSSFGRVKSMSHCRKNGRQGCDRIYKERLLSCSKNGEGYPHVRLTKNGEEKFFNVHKLVAEAFLDNPDNLPCINHKDENPSNNHVENLEYCTHQYNLTYGTVLHRRSKKMRNRKDLSRPVLQYTKDGEFVKEWPSSKEAERHGFDHNYINKCCKGIKNYKTHKGFIWRYKQ